MIIVFLASTLLANTASAKLEAPMRGVSTQLKAHMLTSKVDINRAHDTVGLIVSDEDGARDALDWFLGYNMRYAFILSGTSLDFEGSFDGESTQNIVCFVGTPEHLEDAVGLIRFHPFYKMNARIQFIVAATQNNETWLKNSLDQVWADKILNYVLVYDLGGELRVMGYNPFTNEILNFTNDVGSDNFFVDKLDDTYGYCFHVAMMEDRPRNVLRDGELVGRDISFLNVVKSAFNATVSYVMFESFTDIKRSLENGTTNFSFVKHFYSSRNTYIIVASYPVRMDYLEVAVPTAGPVPTYMYLFSVFSSKLWAYLGFGTLIMIAVDYFFMKVTKFAYQGLSEAVMTQAQIILNVPYDRLYLAATPFKVFLIASTVFSLLLSIGFNTALRSSLITTKYKKDIQDLQELMHQNMEVAMSENYMYTLAETGLVNYKHIIPMKKVADRMLTYVKDRAYALPHSYMELIVSKKDENNRFIYKTLPEYLTAAQSVYNFPENSPFIMKIEQILTLAREFGLASFGTKPKTNRVFGGADATPLAIKHLQSAFYVILFGCAAATVSFIAEIFHFQSVKRLRKTQLISSVDKIVAMRAAQKMMAKAKIVAKAKKPKVAPKKPTVAPPSNNPVAT